VTILNGVYEIHNNDFQVDRWHSLWTQMTPFYRDSIQNWTKAKVRLTIENNRIRFSLLRDTSIIAEEAFKYKIKNNYLVFRNNRLQGIPLLFYRFQLRKIYLNLGTDNKLLTYVRGNSGGGVFIIFFGSTDDHDYFFKNIK
jgi:hypothetical protein